MLLARLLVRQGLHIFIGLYDGGVHLFGYRQHFLNVIYQSVVGLALPLILKLHRTEHIHVVQLHALYAVARTVGVKHLAHAHHRHKGRAVHVNLAVFRTYLFLVLGSQGHYG